MSTCARPADCWDWLHPDDLLRHALAAYYAAAHTIQPPSGEPWICPETGLQWASRSSFRDALIGLLTQRLNVHGLPWGLHGPESTWPELPDGHEWPQRGAP